MIRSEVQVPICGYPSVFVPNLIKYVRDLSEKHADKILNPITGRHSFPSNPLISPKLWNLVQKFDPMRLALSYVEGSVETQGAWDHEIRFFMPSDCEFEESAESLASPRRITELLASFHNTRKLGVARRQFSGIIMPSDKFLAHVRRTFNLQARTCANVNLIRDRIAPMLDAYLDLFNNIDDWEERNPDKSTSDILDIMESFER